MLKRAKLTNYSLDQWEGEFRDIFGSVDAKRSPEAMWLLMMEDAASLAEAIRLDKYGDAQRKIARVFGWTCSFVSRCRNVNFLRSRSPFYLENSLSLIVWNKYPNVCSTCGQERCVCSVRRSEIEEMTRRERDKRKAKMAAMLAAARSAKGRPRTLDGMTHMMGKIYNGAHFNLPIEAIALHFIEEVGEVASCIRKIRENQNTKDVKVIHDLRHNLEEEIADIISWTASAVLKLDYILGASKWRKTSKGRQSVGLKLSEILWKEFSNPNGRYLWCRKCRHRPCSCQVANDDKQAPLSR